MSPGVEELGERVQAILRSHGFRVEVLSYPVDHSRRSIDILARREGGPSVFIKVTEDAAALPATEVRELRRASAVLDAKPLMVADREAGQELDEIAAYERAGVYTVSSEGLRRVVSEEGVYVVRRQGRFYMRVNGERLREARERRGMSLGDLASLLGVSRRSVYMYERGASDIALDKAIRLLEVFGEEVFKPINILESSEYPALDEHRPRFDTAEEEALAAAAEAAGGRVVHMRYTAADMAVAVAEERSVIVVEHRRDTSIAVRAEEAAKIGRYTGSRLYALVRSRSEAGQLEDHGFTVYTSVAELAEELRRRG